MIPFNKDSKVEKLIEPRSMIVVTRDRRGCVVSVRNYWGCPAGSVVDKTVACAFNIW